MPPKETFQAPNANQIGVFQNPSAPQEHAKTKSPVRGANSPFRTARQDIKQPAAFAPFSIKTKTKPQLGEEVPIIDLQSTTSIISVQKTQKVEQLTEQDKQEQMTSEVLHFMADPQILVSFVTNPGELPRSIALERKRRSIASQDFVTMFQKFMDEVKQYQSKLALELFDDELFETKTLKAWFDGAKKVDIYDPLKNASRTVKGLYCHVYLQNEWQKCIVIGKKQNSDAKNADYDDRLLVQRRTDKQEKFWVPRLFVFIWGEDPAIYLKRLNEAKDTRCLTESVMRYEQCVYNMPLTDLIEMDEESVKEITEQGMPIPKSHIAYLSNYAFVQHLEQSMPDLIVESQKVFKQAQNQMLFEISLETQPSLITELQLQLAQEQKKKLYTVTYQNEDKQMFAYQYMNNEPCPNSKITELKQNFKKTFEKICFESFLLQDEAVKCLQITQSEVAKLLQMDFNEQELKKFSLIPDLFQPKLPFDLLIPQNSLFQVITKTAESTHPTLAKTYSLEEFKAMQSAQQSNLQQFLRDNWVVQLRNQLIDVLKNSGKGHYNIYVKTKEVYKQSKLNKLIKRIMLKLCDGLRDLTDQSTDQYVEMFYKQSLWNVDAKSFNEVTNTHPDNENCISTIYRQPLFAIMLSATQQPYHPDDRQLIEKMNATYIVGMSPLTDEPLDLDDHDDRKEEAKQDDNADENGDDAPVETQQAAAQPVQQTASKKKKEEKKEDTALHIQYLTEPKEYIEQTLAAYDAGFKAISGIPSIEYQVLQSIQSHEECTISSPNPLEDQFMKQREMLVEYLSKSIAPLQIFKDQYSQFKELLIIDEEKWAATIKFRAEMYLKVQQDTIRGVTDGMIEYIKGVPIHMKPLIEAATPLSPQDLRNLVHEKLELAKTYAATLPECVHCGAFAVKTFQLKNVLIGKCESLAGAVTKIINEIAQQKSMLIQQLFYAINRKLTHKAKTIEEVIKTDAFIKSKLDPLIETIKQNVVSMNLYHSILEELFQTQNNSQVAQRWRTVAFPKEITKQVEKSLKIIQEDKVKFKDEQNEQQQKTSKDLENLSRQVASFGNRYLKLEEFEQAYEECTQNTEQLDRMIAKAIVFNTREQLMGQPPTDYSSLQQLKKEFEPLKMIWKCVFDFRTQQSDVMTKDFKEVDALKVEQIIDECQRNLAKASRNITEEKLKELTDLVKKEINGFKQQLPLLVLLRNPGLRKRHWMKITKETGVDLKKLRYINGVELKNYGAKTDEDEKSQDYSLLTKEQVAELNMQPVCFTFKQALNDCKLDRFVEKIKVISEAASKEYAIESILSKLEDNWSGVNFTLVQYQNADCYVLKAVDEIIQMLDDNINLIQSMSSSSFKVFFLESINSWDYKLGLTSEIIDVWIQVQQAWLYLEPIFASADIVRQLPTESKNFKTVDVYWRKFMSQVQKRPNVIDVCVETDKLLIKLTENLKILETVQKGLADYLETKRIAFPRFFFLSDEELLSILSNTKNPTSVQPFLRSCFENMARIKFLDEEKGYEMQSMTSHEGEVVVFAEPLLPQGQVESWMTQLERLAIKTVKLRCAETMVKYLEMTAANGIQGRANWVRCGFSQGIILINQIMFCNDTEWAIKNGVLPAYLDQLNKQLSCLTELVRVGLSKLESKVFAALLTYDVFQRDKIQTMIDQHVTDIQDFEWSKHPKHICNVDSLYQQPIHGKADFYYKANYAADAYDKMVLAVHKEAKEIGVEFLVSYQQILSTLPYQFEYLGNTPRLVITPLTLKIYSTISQSQGMYKFTSASGPAGSGKTETSKQLSNKELGLVCVVFNCSEGLDLIGIKRMLSGVISSGGCLVMDEINRLSLDVLSVFAQMVLGVQRGLQLCGGSIVKPPRNECGKLMAHIQTTKILFENTELNLQSTAAVIITQNPNYSGRQKLPANLVALFRAVSVMVPNYQKICQIRLYSFGFKKATSLAQKAVSVFKLCSEQLSQCSWYDYGMRAINSTIQAAGNIRQELANLCVQEVDQVPKDKLGQIDSRYYTEDQIVLRAITEVNLPKFLQNDALLFNNILKDLFPGVKQPFIDYKMIIDELNQVLRSNLMGFLQPEQAYVNKIVDLYMTINLRHGLMTLGLACAGKTQSIYGLTEAMNRLNKREVDQRLVKFNQLLKSKPHLLLKDTIQHIPEDFQFMRYFITRLNPKSITMDQLFGQFDAVSKEWQDGILSTCVRNAVADYNKYLQSIDQTLYVTGYSQGANPPTISDVNPDVYVQKTNYTRQLILCDGYMDSLWIESLNTVLDDSKRLCLTSGEIICLTPVMNFIFNMDSVAEASPATISRNGMLYYTSLEIIGVASKDETDPGQLVMTGTLSLKAFIQTYIDRLPDQIRLMKPDLQKLQEVVTRRKFETKLNTKEEYGPIALRVQELCEKMIPDAIAIMKNYGTQLQETMDSALVLSLFKLFSTFISEMKLNDFGLLEQYQIKLFEKYTDSFFLFSLIWAIGGTLGDEKSRISFDKWLRFRWGAVSQVQIPTTIAGKKASVFDLTLIYPPYEEVKELVQKFDTVEEAIEGVNITFQTWGQEKLNNINLSELVFGADAKVQASMMQSINLSELIVPSMANIQQNALIRRLLINGNHTLAVGSTGSGKTSVIKNYLLKNKEDAAVNIPIMMNFSANTQAGEVRNYLDGKLEKRKRGVYGPQVGKKFLFYVDDLNLPMKERYGCINSHELVRQMIAHGGWFDLKELTFKSVVETYVISSMVQAGGSRNPVTQRLLRHFNVINFLEMNEEQLQAIFGQIINWWAEKVFDVAVVGQELNTAILKVCQKLTPTSVSIYSSVRSALLPTPAKMHYTYNLRDLSKLFQGILMVNPQSISHETGGDKGLQLVKADKAEQNMLMLFAHENLRVFSDRLVDEIDQKKFMTIMMSETQKRFSSMDFASDNLLYGDFASSNGGYQQMNNIQIVNQKVQEGLMYYNESHAKDPMNLVLFKSAISHLCRIVRILRQPNSNMLIIGVGGVGRFSLTKLASSILSYDMFSIQLKKGYGIPDWRNDVKECLMQCGLQQKQQVFLIQDPHIFNDRQLEDISIMLNSCDLQSFYEVADLEKIYNEMKIFCPGNQTKINLYDTYLQKVKQNLHVVICFSPSGSALRTRLRKFPSLVNCCSIDYILSWPEEALVNVAEQVYQFKKSDVQMIDPIQLEFLKNFIQEQEKLQKRSIDEIQNGIIQYCVSAHLQIEAVSAQYKKEQSRHNHVTPTLYLNLIQIFIQILQMNFTKVNTYKMQLSNGLDQLQSAEVQVAKLSEELKELQPQLIEKSKQVEVFMGQLKIDEAAANITREAVTEEKKNTGLKVDECKKIEKNASDKLATGNAQLAEALKALDALERADFLEVATYKNPSQAIINVIEATSILLALKSKKVTVDGKTRDDFSDEIKKQLSNPNMVSSLKNFDKENIPQPIIVRLKPYIENKEFDPVVVVSKSKACAGLCAWVHAMYSYHFINQEVVPLRIEQKKANEELQVAQAKLADATEQLRQTEEKIAKLKAESQATEQEKKRIQEDVENTQKKLVRASTLITSLKGEKLRWIESLKQMDVQIKCLLGDSLFAAAYVIYAGAFTSDFRQRLSALWVAKIREVGFETSKQKPLATEILSDQVTLMNYVNQYKLPSDQHSKENAAMLFTTQKFCLLVDPEKQAQNFLKNYYREQGCEISKANAKDLLRTLENCIRFGKVMVIINVTEEIDPSLAPVLEKQLVKESGQMCVKLGDSFIPYNPSFKLFLCTHLANPNFSPEQFVKLTVLNFAITPLGLQDQLLGALVALERPDQEALKNSLMVSNAKMKMELKSLEGRVLELLATNTGNILDNLTLIDTLALSQKTSAEILVKVSESEITEAEIDKTRVQYIPMAQRGSILYFCIQDLIKIDFMYQYSLNWFMSLYVQSIQDTEQDNDILKRLDLLIGHFTLFLYQTVCRSLFEVHKSLFAFLMTVRIQLSLENLQIPELKYLLVGSQSSSASRPNPQPDWLADKSWYAILDIEHNIEVFQGFSRQFEDFDAMPAWKKIFESQNPETERLPEYYEKELNPFQRFFIIQILRPDRITAYSRIYIHKMLGAEYIQPQTFNLEKSFKDSTNLKPILFLLNDMADPMSDLMTFADSMRMGRKIQALSLGRGIEKAAIQLIQQFAERGSWAVLQNCHISPAFLKMLEGQLEELEQESGSVHRDFRLFLTSQPTTEFPVNILQSAVKISVENPNNLKANLIRVWENNISDRMLQEGCQKQENIDRYKKLTYSLSLFYSVLLQRKKYGSIGFNTPYTWSAADVAICIQQLPTFLDRYTDSFPRDALLYLFAEINIGGCVTDATDQRTVNAIASDYLRIDIFEENWVFQQQKRADATTMGALFRQLKEGMAYSEYIEHLKDKIPIECHPENLGLNLNSNITADKNESQGLLDDLLRVQTGKLVTTEKPGHQGAKTAVQLTDTQVINILQQKIPTKFDLDAITLKYPTMFEESLNSLLVQECGRFNILLETMTVNLEELVRALGGLTIMSYELEEVLQAVTMNKLPEMFARYSYPSLKPLASYMVDLNTRVKFLANWIEYGKPRIYNISLFFFAQGFLTSVLQNFARKYSVAIDTISFDFGVTDQILDDHLFVQNGNTLKDQKINLPPTEDGTFISGLYLEAACYSIAEKRLVEAKPRELYSKMPILLFTPIKEALVLKEDQYECPSYRTLARFGMLSTTGHSTNFMLMIYLPCLKGEGRHWIKRSVAMFATLSD